MPGSSTVPGTSGSSFTGTAYMHDQLVTEADLWKNKYASDEEYHASIAMESTIGPMHMHLFLDAVGFAIVSFPGAPASVAAPGTFTAPRGPRSPM